MVFNIQRQENIQRESLSFLYTHKHTHTQQPPPTPLPTIIIITVLASRSGVSSLGMETPERHPRQLVVSLLHPLHTFRAFALAVPLQAHTPPLPHSILVWLTPPLHLGFISNTTSSGRPGLATSTVLCLLTSFIFLYRTFHSWASCCVFPCSLTSTSLPVGSFERLHDGDHVPRA